MDISILAVLIFLLLDISLCENYRNSSFDNDLPSSDLIIYTTGGPVPDYLLNSPYKIVPLPRNNFGRRADDSGAIVEFSSKELQNSTIVGGFTRDTSLRYQSQASNRPIRKNRKQNKNRSGRRNLERYNQRVESTDGGVAVPIKTQPKGQDPSTELERNVAIPNRSKRPAYTTDSNKLTSPSYLYRERNAADSDQSERPVYINDVTPTSPYRERNIANSENSNGNAYINDASKSTVPSFLLPSENFPTPLAYSPVSKVYSASPSYLPPKVPTPPAKFNKFPRPAVKKYEAAAYDFGPLYKPYSFGYDVFDGYGTKQYRQESATRDGVVRGNYGYKDFQGIYRQVEYIADENGFHAVLKSNEPGLSNVDTADVSVNVEPPPIWPPSQTQVL